MPRAGCLGQAGAGEYPVAWILSRLVTVFWKDHSLGHALHRPSTVKTHLRSVYHKLGAATRSQALERAVDLRLL